VHAHDGVEVARLHVPDGPVAHDARVVDEDVQPPPGVDGAGHHRLSVRLVPDVAVVGDRSPTHGTDGVDHPVGVTARAFPADGAPEVVDDDRGAVPRQFKCVRLSDAVTGSGHQGGATSE